MADVSVLVDEKENEGGTSGAAIRNSDIIGMVEHVVIVQGSLLPVLCGEVFGTV